MKREVCPHNGYTLTHVEGAKWRCPAHGIHEFPAYIRRILDYRQARAELEEQT